MEPVAKKLTSKIMNGIVTIGFLKAICKGEGQGVDLAGAAIIAEKEIYSLLAAHVDLNDNWLDFVNHMEKEELKGDPMEAIYEAACQGYEEGYLEAFSDVLRILAKYGSAEGEGEA